jgi:hypothetical protein
MVIQRVSKKADWKVLRVVDVTAAYLVSLSADEMVAS